VFFLSLLSFGQSQEDIKEEADKLFENENYKEAHTLYVKLLAMDARSFEYNFRYGACVLLLSNNKTDAFKHLKYAITSPTVNVESYYYLGRAYHLNYQFQEAIKHYKLYLSKIGEKPNEKLDANRQIQMCENGKKLITTITEMVILEKKEIEVSKFFRLYDLQNIGGDLLVTLDFQSKIDKKKGHVPLVHFPTNPRIIYYSSYGDKDENGLDIYVRRRLPNGTWGLPQSISGGVNTPYDEDFPYMHPSGRYLYFSSKGHNSMGGYDVFRSTFDPETNMYGPAENMDFAVSSPDDDVFYVVDSLNKYAYFGSTRQSEAGKVYVYKTMVDRVPTQFSVAKGEFLSTVDPAIKVLNLDITDYSSGQSIGNFNSNKEGIYIATFPKGGKYEYTMRVEGRTEEYKIVVTIPFQKEFRPLKQKIVHEFTDDRVETIRIVNLFNEEVEGASELLALVIKKQSELAPNSQDFDLSAIEAKKIDESVLTDLGLEKYSLVEIDELISKQVEKALNKENGVLKLEQNLYAQIVENTKEIKQIDRKIESLINQVSTESNSRIKLDKLLEVEHLIDQQKDLQESSTSSLRFADSLSNIEKVNDGVSSKDLIALKTEYSKLVQDDKEQEALDLLKKNKTLLKASIEKPSRTMLEDLVEENIALQKDIDKLTQKRRDFETNVRELKKSISDLEASLESAKNKDKPVIESKIESSKNDLRFIEGEINYLEPQLNKLLTEKKLVDNQIENLQKANGIKGVEASKSDAQSAISSVQPAKNIKLLSEIQGQMVSLKEEIQNGSVEVASNEASIPVYKEVKENYISGVDEIENNNTLSAIDKKKQVIALQDSFLKTIEEELLTLDEKINSNPADENLKTRREELLTEKVGVETKRNVTVSELDQLNSVSLEEVANQGINPGSEGESSTETEHEIVTSPIDPKTNEVAENTETTESESENINTTSEEGSETEVSPVDVNENEVAEHAETTESESENINTTSIEGNETEVPPIDVVSNELAENTDTIESESEIVNSTPVVENEAEKKQENTELTTKSIVEDVMPNFLNRREQLEFDPSVNDEVRPILLESMNQQLVDRLNMEKSKIEKELETKPKDEKLLARLATIEKAKSEVISGDFPSKEVLVENSKVNPANVGVENESTTPIASQPVVSEETVLLDVAPSYKSSLSEIEDNNSLSPKDKLSQKVAIQEDVLAKLDTEKKLLQQNLANNPEDNTSMQKLAVVNKMTTQIEAEYIADFDNLAVLEVAEEPASTLIIVTKESIINDLYPNYNENKTAISNNSDLAELDKLEKLQEEDELMLRSVNKELAQVDKSLSKKENEENLLKKKELESLQNTLESEMSERQQEINAHQTIVVEEITQDDKDRAIAEVSPSYKSDLGAVTEKDQTEISRYKALNELEGNLKLDIEKKIEKLDKKLKKDAENKALIAEKSTLEVVLEESNQRIAQNDLQIKSLESIATTENEVENSIETVPTFRKEILGEQVGYMEETYSSTEELEEQKSVLVNYEIQLNKRLIDTPLEPEETKEIQEEIEFVQQKRSAVENQLNGVEVVAEQKVQEPEYSGTPIDQLNQKEEFIQTQLASKEISENEKEQLETELAVVQSKRIEIEYNELVQSSAKQKATNEKLEDKLNAVIAATPDPSLPIQRALVNTDRLNSEITALESNLNKTKSIEEKKNILLELQEKELAYESTVNEALVDNEIQSKRSTEVLTLYTPSELEQKRRKFSVSIGDIDYQIEQLNKEIASLKPSKAKVLLTEKASLVAEKQLLEKELAMVMEQLKAYQPVASTIDNKAIEAPISYKEERELALTKNYKDFELVAVDAIKTEQDLKFIDKSLIQKRAETKEIITKSVLEDPTIGSVEISEKLDEVKVLEEKQRTIQEELLEKQSKLKELKESLPEAVKMENMVNRGVQPQNLLAVAVPRVANIPEKGIEILNKEKGQYNDNNPIPVDVKNPTGLVYRVQVGAFSKPIPQDLFNEFVPVSGEKLNNGITRYMAGFFNSSETVVDAKDKIRALGYSDAFVVAYCDGKRISYSEARALELSGQCVPKGTNELLIEVAQNTAEKMEVLDSSNLVVPEIDEFSYNRAPGAAKAIAVESRLGLFFTVQVGVFNGPVKETELKNIQPLVTKRLPNGQVRYSSGMFKSIDEARPKKAEAIQRGVTDAFITAYYKGERITLREAQDIIANEGEQVIEQITPEEKVVESNPILNTESNLENDSSNVNVSIHKNLNKDKVQLISSKEYRSFPREDLNRYNHFGNFFYDIHEHKIKSVIFESVSKLPVMTALSDEFDTLVISKNFLNDRYAYELEVKMNKEELSGAFGEWLLRTGYTHTISVISSNVAMRFFTNTLLEQVSLKEQLLEFGIDAWEVEKELDNY
jgi:epidermal growth factor receptor substrate 15